MDYKVSKTTALYIDALRESDKLYDAVVAAVKEHYAGDLTVLDTGFNKAFDDLNAELYALLSRSIHDNLAFSDSEEI